MAQFIDFAPAAQILAIRRNDGEAAGFSQNAPTFFSEAAPLASYPGHASTLPRAMH